MLRSLPCNFTNSATAAASCSCRWSAPAMVASGPVSTAAALVARRFGAVVAELRLVAQREVVVELMLDARGDRLHVLDRAVVGEAVEGLVSHRRPDGR